MASYTPHNHSFEFDDRGGERSLPSPGDVCKSCGQTWLAYSKNPQKCSPRPKFTPKAETRSESLSVAQEAKSEGYHTVNGHQWPKTELVPNLGTPCAKCGVEFGNPLAVYSCSGVQMSAETRKVMDEVRPVPAEQKPAEVIHEKPIGSHSDSEVWLRFACAAVAAVVPAVPIADAMLAEYRQRFPK